MQPIETSLQKPQSTSSILVDRYSGDAANWNIVSLFSQTWNSLTGILAMQPIETEHSALYNNFPVDRYSGDAANWNTGTADYFGTNNGLTGILAMQPIETLLGHYNQVWLTGILAMQPIETG